MVPKTALVLNCPSVINSVVADGALSFLLHQILLYFIVIVAPSWIFIPFRRIVLWTAVAEVRFLCRMPPPAERRVPLSHYRNNFLRAEHISVLILYRRARQGGTRHHMLQML